MSAAHREVSRQHAAAAVPGDVPGECGQRGDLPDRHEEHVQPQTVGAQEVRPEGEKLVGSVLQKPCELTFDHTTDQCFTLQIRRLLGDFEFTRRVALL